MTELPKGWSYSRLDEVATIIRGVTYSSKDVLPSITSEAVRLLRATNIQNGVLDFVDPVWIPRSLVKSQQLLSEGDVVIATSSGSIQIVGKSASVKSSIDATFGAFCTTVRAKAIQPGYLAHYLQDPTLRQKWSDLAGGSNINNLKTTDIAATPIPVPPLDEQKRIVEALDDHLSRLDKAGEELDSASNKCSAFRSSILNELFNPSGDGDQELPAQWETKPLGDLADTQLGKMLNRSNQLGDSTIPYLRNINVQWGRIDLRDVKEMDIYPDEFSKFTASPGDLLVCEGGESGRAAIWDGTESIGIQNALHRIRPHAGLLPRYLLYYFEWQVKARLVDHLFSGVTITHFTQEKLRKMLIQYPPIKEQQLIVDRLDSSLDALERTQHGIDKQRSNLLALRRSVLNQAFKGNLRKGER
jgi:type I restriction enzyme S subunit